ncbi:secondary metabolism biosynthetic enzyme [Penicillium atrosanguineum]|nr:secondary metabolism biosynthetic enzyme [Penicillium atrosanguineum]
MEFRPENQLLPNLIDHYARVKPDAIYAEYPRSPVSYAEGYRPITYRQFANVINGLASWLTETFGPGTGEVLAYFGPNDVRYPALVLGAVKAGYCIFLTSPRNSIAAHESLLKSLECTKFLFSSPRPPPVTAVVDALQLESLDVPSVEDLLSTKHPHVEYDKTYPEDAADKMVVVHTSGSTGLPKPVVWSLETANAHMRMVALNSVDEHENQHSWLRGKRQFLTLPPFHAAGLASVLFFNAPLELTVIVPSGGGLPTASAMVEAHKEIQFETALLVPSILNELAESPRLLDYCSQNMEYLMYAGGDLPQPIGDRIAAKIKLSNQYGATEMGFLSLIHSTSNRDPLTDWRWMHFHPDLGVELRQVTEDEYELWMTRSPEKETHQFAFAVFPHLQEYSTRDLFVRHPNATKSNLWRWSSRADDVIIFLNGEKTNPVSVEQHIAASNTEVTGVLVGGFQRFQASLLLEIGDKALNPSERAAAIEKIWPSIEEANRVCPTHARIAKTHVLFTTPEKPMLRAGKGTVQRAGTLALYKEEINALYVDADKLAVQTEIAGPGTVDNEHQVSNFIQLTLVSITGWNPEQVGKTENFFSLGLDSLQVITAARAIKNGLHLSSFTPNLIYLHPSLSCLVPATLQLMRDDRTSEKTLKEAYLRERDDLLKELQSQLNDHQLETVILTGSTGNLGTYMLDALLKSPSVGHIHCLNRKEDAPNIQRQKFDYYNLHTSLESSRITFWRIDLSRKDLGLATEILKRLQNTATVIIHNAWNVNFNLSLSSFKSDLKGMANLINFTTTSSKSPHLFFISSISSVMNHFTETRLTPETTVKTSQPAPNGYANSKYLAEQLLHHASKQHSIRASFARVGQIAGPVKMPGLWNQSEWFPSLVMSSLQVGAIPESMGSALDRIDWVPIDLLAEVLVDLVLSQHDEGCKVYHPLNLCPTTWDRLLPDIINILNKSSDKEIEKVCLFEWTQRVRRDIETGSESRDLQVLLEKNPAAKLLEFFERISSLGEENVLDTRQTEKKSSKLRSIPGVKNEWLEKWIGEWMAPVS